MSAWYCSDTHLAYLINSTIRLADDQPGGMVPRWRDPAGNLKALTPETFQETGQMLRDLNLLNLAHRYSGREKSIIPEDTRFHGSIQRRAGLRPDLHPLPEPVQVLKAIRCYRYQCDDEAIWTGSEAQAFTDALIDLAVENLPGYEEAEWGPPRQAAPAGAGVG